MKNLIIIFLLFLSVISFSQDLTEQTNDLIVEAPKMRVLNSFYGIDQEGNNTFMQLVEYRGYKGIKCGMVYFLTDKWTFNETMKYQKQCFKWYVFTDKGYDILRVRQHIWIYMDYDYTTDIVNIIVTSEFDGSMFNHIVLTLYRSDIIR